MQWEIVIGLETHVQLSTQSKLFSGSATAFGALPNTQASVIDLAMPGTLPSLNEKAVEMAILFGVAVKGQINPLCEFARKNYFYPDLPKGYQISQYEHPIIQGGQLEITVNEQRKSIRLHHAHLEEDAGKSMHGILPGLTGIDLNRAGTPLLEIVTEPDLRSAEEAVTYLKTLHSLIRALNISDANMQEGSFRCDVNISIRRQGDTQFGTRTELKNLNSFRFIEKAIEFESHRQIDLLLSGQTVTQETRLYDEQKNITKSMRSKEDAQDYRYFPDPDLLPLSIAPELIEKIRLTLPELPQKKIHRFQQTYQLSLEEAQKIVNDTDLCHFFESAVALSGMTVAKRIAHWLMGDVAALLNKEETYLPNALLKPQHLADLAQAVENNTISSSIAKQILLTLWQQGGVVNDIIVEQGLTQISDESALAKLIDELVQANPAQAADYRAGKTKLITFFVGQVMKQTAGKANPTQVNALLKEKLG